jgi:hypothetical protein
MCDGSKLPITTERCRRQASPLAENTPSKPISRAIMLRRVLRRKPPGRSRRIVAIVSGLATTKNSRGPIRNRK